MQIFKRIKIDRATLFVVIYVVVQFFYSYWTHPQNPRLRAGLDAGWYQWSDQAGYLQIATNLAQGHRFFPLLYGPGYPVIGAPFVGWLPLDPFLIPDLALYVITIVLYLRIARAFLSIEISVLAIVLLSQSDQFLDFFIEPWSNVVTTICLGVLLYGAIYPPRRRGQGAMVIGVCLGWTFAARYTDALLLLPAAAAMLWLMTAAWRERWKASVMVGLTLIPFIAWVMVLHTNAFGSPFITPYQFHIDPNTGLTEQALASRSITGIGSHVFSLLINPNVFYPQVKFTPVVHSVNDRPFLSYYFVVVLVGVGLAFAWRQRRALVMAFVVSFGLALGAYGSSWATAGDQLQHHALRFFAPWEPLLIIGAVIGVISMLKMDLRSSRDRRTAGVGMLATMLFMTIIYGWARLWPPFP